MKKGILLFIVLIGFSYNGGAVEKKPTFGRLDPHGEKDFDTKSFQSLKRLSQCTVCHFEKNGKIHLIADPGYTCLNCHNKGPHSGAAEHLGKKSKFGKIDCMSCHSPHRFTQIAWENPGHFNAPLLNHSYDPQFQIRTKKDAMMKRTCTECHKW